MSSQHCQCVSCAYWLVTVTVIDLMDSMLPCHAALMQSGSYRHRRVEVQYTIMSVHASAAALQLLWIACNVYGLQNIDSATQYSPRLLLNTSNSALWLHGITLTLSLSLSLFLALCCGLMQACCCSDAYSNCTAQFAWQCNCIEYTVVAGCQTASSVQSRKSWKLKNVSCSSRKSRGVHCLGRRKPLKIGLLLLLLLLYIGSMRVRACIDSGLIPM